MPISIGKKSSGIRCQADSTIDSSLHVSNDESKECSHCGAIKTIMWRRNTAGDQLCDACGLYLRIHQTNRPLSKPRGLVCSAKSPVNALNYNDNPQCTVCSAIITPISYVGKYNFPCVEGYLCNGCRSYFTVDCLELPSTWFHGGRDCAQCWNSSTSLWRRGRDGKLRCNDCGLKHLKAEAVRPVIELPRRNEPKDDIAMSKVMAYVRSQKRLNQKRKEAQNKMVSSKNEKFDARKMFQKLFYCFPCVKKPATKA